MTASSQTAARADGRTHYEAVLDIRYGMRFNDLCARWYAKADGLLAFVSLMGTSTAVLSVVSSSPATATAAGIVLTAVGTISLLLAPGRKAEQHLQARKAYAELDARSQQRTLEELDVELRILQGTAPSGLALLARPAYNANLMTAGRPEYQMPLRFAERAMLLLA